MIADHGGFDLLLELSSDALVNLAAGAFFLPPITQTLNFPAVGVSGAATFTPTVSSIQPVAGPALRIDLDVALDFVANTPVGPVTIGADSDAPITGSITAGLVVNGLQVQVNSAGGLSPVVNVDLSDDAGVQMILAAIVATSGPAAADAALAALEAAMANAVINAINALPPIALTLFTFPTNLTPTAPATVPPLVIGFARGNLLIGVTLGGTPGNLAAVTNDNVFEVFGESVGLVINNRCLLQDLLRPGLLAALALPAAGFSPTHPLLWNGSMPMIPTDLGPINLTSVRASTAAPNRVVLDLTLNGNLAEGAVSVSARVRATATVGLAMVGGALTITLTIAPIAVLDARADIAWWVYAAAAFGGAPLLATAIGIVDLVIDGELGGIVAGLIDTSMFPNLSMPLPAALSAGLTPGRATMLMGPTRVTGTLVEPTHELLLTLRST